MRLRLLDSLACPICLNPLAMQGDPHDPVTEGTLICQGCSSNYDIRVALPLLLLKDKDWAETKTEVEGERELVDELPFPEHIKRNHFEAQRSLRLLEQVRVPNRPLVLDVGGSSGLGAYLFKRYGARVVIVDIVPHLLKVGEACLRGRMDFDIGLAGMEWLPFRSNTFDLVFCRQALHHSSQPSQVARELFRVAKIGGQVLIASEPCVSILDVWRTRRAVSQVSASNSKADEILSKLPDSKFVHTWPEFRDWMAALTDRFMIQAAGGAAGLIPTPNGLVYDPNAAHQKPFEESLLKFLPGGRGFRGDINLVGTKTTEVSRLTNPHHVEPVRPEDFQLVEFDETEVQNCLDFFPKMFPFPIE